MMLVRTVLAAGVLGAALSAPPASGQTDYPTRPIRVLVPFAPGGGSDVLVRSIGVKITEKTGQPVVIDNRPGANGIVAASLAAKAAADGYTVLLDTTNMVLNSVLARNLTYNAMTDFDPVAMPAWVTHVVAVNPKATVPIADFADLLRRMRSSPGRITYGSFGTGSTAHLAGELLDITAGTKSIHVPYKGGAPAIAALLGNEIDIAIGTVPLVMPYLKSGQLRAIAVTSANRIGELPDVPAVAETLPGYEVNLWWAFVVPVGTPRPVIAKLSSEIRSALADVDVRQKLAGQGFNLVSGSPDELGAFIRSERSKWEKVISTAGIKLE
ncbi:MAG: ABC transporter substrate-binding protein [Betaproteobacteria bacterium]|nr:MAG: ABC transporter substrate-binding protein [Betaproteobacteria bacterium]